MNSLSTADTLGAIVARDYRAGAVLERHGLDFCCNGGQTLEEACLARGVDPEAVVGALARLDPAESVPAACADADLDAMVDHITGTHHCYVRRALPLVEGYLEKLVAAHGERHPELSQVRQHFRTLAREMESHMAKEEELLFPYVASLARAGRGEGTLPPNMFGTVQHPIRVMEVEHESAGSEVAAIRNLTGGYLVPPEGCATYRATMGELKAFEADLHVHVHLENHVLFPRAIELESRLRAWD